MKKIFVSIILLTVILLYTRPYFHPGFFATHDGEWAIVRLTEMWREIKDGQVPPRWADYLNHGFGYPLFSFTYPAPYYLGTVFKLIGFGFTDSIKILFVASIALSAFFMYLLGRSLTGEWGGVLAAIFYTTAPFRLVDLYIRGSLGESLSFVILPALFYFCIKYIQKPVHTRLIFCSLCLFLLILTHNVTALLFFPIMLGFFYTATKFYKKDAIYYGWRHLLPILVLGLGLSAYFFLPAILEKKFLYLSNVSLADISSNFVKPQDYLTSKWNYDLKPSYQLGLVNIAGALVGLVAVFINKNKAEKRYRSFIWFIVTVTLVLIILASEASSFFWKFPPLSWIDFPWRLLTPLTFMVSLTTIFLGLNSLGKVLGTLLAILAIFLNLSYAKPKEFIKYPDVYYTTNDATTTSMDELMPLWVTDKPKNRYSEKVEVVLGQALVSNLKYNSKIASFDLEAAVPSTVKINTIYFPGWQIRANGDSIPIDYNNPQGVMQFQAPSGNYKVVARFTETPVRRLANLITIISLGVVIILFIKPIISS